MSASGTKHGRTARTMLVVLAGLLALGVAVSVMMSLRARNDAMRLIAEQAQTINERSLTLVFTPEDLDGPADTLRAAEISEKITRTVLDPSDFSSVVLYGSDGTILYATEMGRIGTTLVGEQERIREALKGITQTRSAPGTFSVLSSFRFPSGVGRPAAVELTRNDAPIATAATPWRTNAMFLSVILVLLCLVAYGVNRISAAATAMASRRDEAAKPSAAGPPRAPIAAPHPGLREEAEARRRSEERATAAEERLAVLQDQYRKTLEELQNFQRIAREPRTSDPEVEQRALRAEGQLRSLQQQLELLTDERERLGRALRDAEARAETAGQVAPTPEDLLLVERTRQENAGLRAELEGTLTQLEAARKELEEARRAAAAGTAAPSGELTATHTELARTKDELATIGSQLRSAQRELEDARGELRALRTEEQRAAMLEDELRAAKAEADSLRASHRAELVEREAEFEEKVRATREEFQRQLGEIEASYKGQMGKREADLASRIAASDSAARDAERELETLRSELETARAEVASREQRLIETADSTRSQRAEVEALRAELAGREQTVAEAIAEADRARTTVDELQAEIHRAHEAVAQLREELAAERAGASDAIERAQHADLERTKLAAHVERFAQQLEAATGENAELNRRLQEIEARRQLELADDQGRAEIDDLLRVTQERLAGQTEKLMTAEDRVRTLEAELTSMSERIDVAETELRTHRMAEALKEMREGEHGEGDAIAQGEAAAQPLEDRRASSPFTKELSLDAKKTLARIIGVTQILKHKKDAKEQAQLIRQLTTYARRLDHTVADLAEADVLAHGEIELQIKRTDLEALVHRVVEESGVDADHDVRVQAEALKVGVDPLRTEQIVAGMLRASGDRTPTGKEIVVRVFHREGGAVISVEDPEASSDASLSPVVKRFAEAHGGWAKVESREDGGSAFRVYLPDGSPASDEVKVLVDGEQPQVWDDQAEKILVQELHRLAELPDQEGAKSSGRSRRAGRKG
jgi:hypothetical protein